VLTATTALLQVHDRIAQGATAGLYAHRTARHRVKVGECLSSAVEPL
jgi:hypothetical protein